MLSPADLFAIVFAPFIGSFIATYAVRFGAARSAFHGRSGCPACGKTLGPASLVPVVSWVLQQGRCRSCRAPISVFYPAVELAALACAIWAAVQLSGWLLAVGCIFGWTLLTLAVVDIRRLVLPDCLTLPLIPAGIAIIYVLDPGEIWSYLAATAVGGLAFAVVAAGYERLRGIAGLGLGDAKLMAAAGAWVGPAGLVSVVLIASVLGLIWALLRRLGGASLGAKTVIPFGPFLAFATWFVWLHGPLRLDKLVF